VVGWYILYLKERTRVPTKVNVVLDDDVKEALEQLVESGMRSRVVNRALRRELQIVRRLQASERLDRLRVEGRPVSTAEVLRLLRKDRGRG
jgi:Arc/MetJ-type ribon-helix-helix transcriptional regulator